MTEKTPWFVENTREIGEAFQNFHEKCRTAGVLDAKTRELLMMSLACAFRCSHCTQEHIEKARRSGASDEEISEALLITALEGAGTQLYWLKDRYEELLGS